MVLQPSICWGAPTAEAELCGLMVGCPPWRAGREVCAVLRRGECTPPFSFRLRRKENGPCTVISALRAAALRRLRSETLRCGSVKRKAAIVQTSPMGHGESLGMRPPSRYVWQKLAKPYPAALDVGGDPAFMPHLQRRRGFYGAYRKGFCLWPR